jgi:hypothetical protein
MNHLSISEVRADALFVSSLQLSDQPSTGQVRQAIADTVRQLGGPGCVGLVAQEFGEHPELAVTRMRWALRLTAGAFGEPAEPELAEAACCQPHAA